MVVSTSVGIAGYLFIKSITPDILAISIDRGFLLFLPIPSTTPLPLAPFALSAGGSFSLFFYDCSRMLPLRRVQVVV